MYTTIVDSRKPRMYTNIVELSVGLTFYDFRILIRATARMHTNSLDFLVGMVYYTDRPPKLFVKCRPPGLYQDCRPAGGFNHYLISS